MKKIILIALSAITIFSCNKSSDLNNANSTNTPSVVTTNQNTRGVLSSELEQVGYLHNSALQNAYNGINTIASTSFFQGVEIIKNNMKFLSNFKGYSNAVVIANNSTTIPLAKAELNAINNNLMQNSFMKSVYKSLNDIIVTSNTSTEVDTRIMDYFNSKVNNISATERIILTNMCGVCAGSYDFWNTNYDNWERVVLLNKHYRKTKKEKIVEFVLGDVSGAAFGVPIAVICSGLVAWSWD
jgi:hypothetical protein